MIKTIPNIQYATISSFPSILQQNKFAQFGMMTVNKYRYKGPIKAAILDWSGTLSDAGVLAPAVVFVNVLKKHGINITMDQARIPMGLRKDLHIGELLKLDTVRDQWYKKYSVFPSDAERDMLFKDFVPMQLECLPKYATIIEGADYTTKLMRKELDIKLGLTTGFTKKMSDILRSEAEKQGVFLDTTVAGDEVECGARPSPSMLFKNLDHLGLSANTPMAAVVKIDDTVSGVGEGINAGCWTVALTRWSNYTNYDSLEQLLAASKCEVDRRSKNARRILENSGAHYIIEDINGLPDVIYDINEKLHNGIMPTDNVIN